MEMLKDEMVSVPDNQVCNNDVQLRELNELQLALVGGGVGDVIIV